MGKCIEPKKNIVYLIFLSFLSLFYFFFLSEWLFSRLFLSFDVLWVNVLLFIFSHLDFWTQYLLSANVFDIFFTFPENLTRLCSSKHHGLLNLSFSKNGVSRTVFLAWFVLTRAICFSKCFMSTATFASLKIRGGEYKRCERMRYRFNWTVEILASTDYLL